MDQTKIKHQHEELRRQTDDLLKLLDSDFEWGEIDKRLSRLEEALSQHFEMEELGGYLSAVLERAPEQEATVRRLRGSHDDLWSRLAQLRRDAAKRLATEPFRADLAAWIVRLQDHESRENALLASVSPEAS